MSVALGQFKKNKLQQIKTIVFCFLLLFVSFSVFAQSDSITTNDARFFKYSIEKSVIRELEKLQLLISEPGNLPNEVEEIIANKTKAEEKRIFSGPGVNIEYDLNPGADKDENLRNNMDVITYLNAFNTDYSKSENKTVSLSIVSVSALKKVTYPFYNVLYECIYRGANIKGEKFYPFKRIAEVKLVKEKTWKLYINSIYFPRGNEMDSANLYTGIIVSDTLMENLFASYDNEQKRKEREDLNRIQMLIEDGDDKMEQNDFEGAYKIFREARRINIDNDEAKQRVIKSRTALEEKRKQEKIAAERAKRAADMKKEMVALKDDYYFQEAKVLCDSLINDYEVTDAEVKSLCDKLSQVVTAITGIETSLASKKHSEAIKKCEEKIKNEYTPVYKAEYYYRLAVIYSVPPAKDDNKCFLNLSKAIEESNNHHQNALKMRKEIYVHKNQLSNAVEDATQIINNDSRNPENYVLRAALYEQINTPASAIADYGNAIKNKSSNPFVFYTKAKLEYSLDKFSETIKTTTQGLDKDSTQGVLYFLRGLAKVKTGDVKGAGNDFRMSVANAVHDTAKTRIKTISEGYVQEGNVQFKNANYTTAGKLFANAVAIDSSDEGLNMGARCFLNSGKPDSALIFINALMARNNLINGIYDLRGYSYLAQKKYTEAQKDFDEELRRNQLNASSYYGKGICALMAPNFSDAALNFEKSATYASSDSGWYQASVAYFKAKNYDKAIACNNNAQNLNCKKPDLHYWCARAYYEKQNYSSAIKEFQKAYALNNITDDLNYWNARTLEASEKYTEAIPVYRKLIATNGYKNEGYLRTGICMSKIKDAPDYTQANSYLNNYMASDTSADKSMALAWKAYNYLKLDSVDKADECIRRAKEMTNGNSILSFVEVCSLTKKSMFDNAIERMGDALKNYAKDYKRSTFTDEKLLKPLSKKDKFKELLSKYYK